MQGHLKLTQLYINGEVISSEEQVTCLKKITVMQKVSKTTFITTKFAEKSKVFSSFSVSILLPGPLLNFLNKFYFIGPDLSLYGAHIFALSNITK